MRIGLRTLLIVLTLGPPAVGLIIWPEIKFRYRAWLAQKQRDAIDGNFGGLNTIFSPNGSGLVELPVGEAAVWDAEPPKEDSNQALAQRARD